MLSGALLQKAMRVVTACEVAAAHTQATLQRATCLVVLARLRGLVASAAGELAVLSADSTAALVGVRRRLHAGPNARAEAHTWGYQQALSASMLPCTL